MCKEKINLKGYLYLLIVLLFISTNSIGNSVSKTINIKAYGAISDGETLVTKVIQHAIDDVHENGNGQVIFPKGKYLTGSIFLKSGVELVLEEGAVILGSTNPKDYKKLNIESEFESPKKNDNSKLALILAYNAHDIAITGRGTIDGQGRKLALTIDSLHHAGVRIDPKYNNRRMRPNETARPKLINFAKCDSIIIKDVTFKNSACWGLTFELCSNVIIDQLTVISRAYWNNDGIDITDSKNVRITNCDVNTADDGICLKSYYPDHYNDQIYIANCIIRTSASAIKFGTASFGGFKNVTIENIKVFDTFRSAIAIESVDGGHIENIYVSNITAVNTGNAIFVRLGHRGGERPGTVKNITIKNIKVEVPFGRPDIDYDMRGPEVNFFHNQFPSPIAGIPGHYIENITLENIEISYPGRASKGMAYVPVSRLNQVPEKINNYPEYSMFGELPSWGFYVRHVKNIKMKNIRLTLDDKDFRPAFVFDDVEGLTMEEIELPNDKQQQIILKDVTETGLDQNSLQLTQKL